LLFSDGSKLLVRPGIPAILVPDGAGGQAQVFFDVTNRFVTSYLSRHFPNLLLPLFGLPSNLKLLFNPLRCSDPGYLRLTRGTSQKINKIIAMISKIQRIGPVKKPMEKPNTHRTKRIIPIIKSKVSILTSFRS
jgi:hypothetical protein